MARLAVMGTISVIVPSLNDAGYLAVCLDALAMQTRRADEVIVVDNGSTDATAAVARATGARVVDQPVRGMLPRASRRTYSPRSRTTLIPPRRRQIGRASCRERVL